MSGFENEFVKVS